MAQQVITIDGAGDAPKRTAHRMPEHVQNRVIHAGMSLLTIAVTLGGVMAGYYSIQSANREMMIELKTTLVAHGTRISTLEALRQSSDKSGSDDRLLVERRLTQIETYYTNTLRTLEEIKQDVRAIRSEPPRRP